MFYNNVFNLNAYLHQFKCGGVLNVNGRFESNEISLYTKNDSDQDDLTSYIIKYSK
jgi:hypothetical protein